MPALGLEPTVKIARVEVDMSEGELRAFDAENNIVLFSPASVGEGDTRFASANLTVVATSPTPTSPQAPGKKQAVGPNGPDGSMWIELSDPAFAIHGTADPEAIGKRQEQGGVELTNWDVRKLASLAEPGTAVVEFRD